MKLEIRNAAGLRLILSLDQSLTVEQSAGWLSDEELPGSFSYPLKFPISPNEAFLGSSYRPESARPAMDIVVTARMNGVLYRRCVLEYRVTEGEGDGFLKIDAGEVFNKLRNLTLQEALATPVEINTNAFLPLADRMRQIAALPPGHFPLTFFPIRNEGFFEDGLDNTKVAGFTKQSYVNYWKAGAFVVDTDTVRGYPVVPQFYLCWVLEQLFRLAGYRIEGDWFSAPETQCRVVENQTAIPVLGAFVQVKYYPVNPGQHLPKLSVGDFLKAIKQRYGLLFSFDGNRQVVTIRQFAAVIKTPAQDLTQYLAGDYGIDDRSNKGYKVYDAVDGNDALGKDAQGNAVVPVPLLIGGDGTADRQEIKLSLGTTQLIYEVNPDKVSWSVPTVRQPGNMLEPAYKESERYPEPLKPGETVVTLRNDIAFRILSYYGMQPADNGALYPLASPDRRNGRQEIISKTAETLTGRAGLWRTVLRSFYYFRDQTRPVTVDLDMPVAVVAGLKLHEPIALKLSGQTRRHYLVQKLLAESPGTSGLMECKLTALTLPDGVDLAPDVDDPIVWIELILSAVTETRSGANNRLFSRTQTFSVKYYQDRAKTQVAVVTNLTLNVREKKTDIFNPQGQRVYHEEYAETVRGYIVSGQGQTLETNYLIYSLNTVGTTADVPDELHRSLQLDPGDDYNII